MLVSGTNTTDVMQISYADNPAPTVTLKGDKRFPFFNQQFIGGLITDLSYPRWTWWTYGLPAASESMYYPNVSLTGEGDKQPHQPAAGEGQAHPLSPGCG